MDDQDLPARLLALIDADDREGAAALLVAHPSAARARAADGVSLLLHALYRGRTGIAELLDAAGAERDLFHAAALGRADRVRAILERDPAAHAAFSPDGWTPLHLAAFLGRDEAARLLVLAGADMAAVSRNGLANHALHTACAAGRSAVALFLLEAGAPVDHAAAGFTPLLIAAANGLQAVVGALLEAGADPAVRDPAGRTARESAEAGGHAAAAALLAQGS